MSVIGQPAGSSLGGNQAHRIITLPAMTVTQFNNAMNALRVTGTKTAARYTINFTDGSSQTYTIGAFSRRLEAAQASVASVTTTPLFNKAQTDAIAAILSAEAEKELDTSTATPQPGLRGGGGLPMKPLMVAKEIARMEELAGVAATSGHFSTPFLAKAGNLRGASRDPAASNDAR